MNEEIDIQISFTPHSWDNQKEPYFWIILKGNDSKRNARTWLGRKSSESMGEG